MSDDVYVVLHVSISSSVDISGLYATDTLASLESWV